MKKRTAEAPSIKDDLGPLHNQVSDPTLLRTVETLRNQIHDLQVRMQRERLEARAEITFQRDAERVEAEGFGSTTIDLWGSFGPREIAAAFEDENARLRVLNAHLEYAAAFRRRIAVVANALRDRQHEAIFSEQSRAPKVA
jgi:hypothetical protein